VGGLRWGMGRSSSRDLARQPTPASTYFSARVPRVPRLQIAKAFDAEVTACAAPRSSTRSKALGADHVIDYTREDFADGTRRYDAILDIGGNRRLTHLRRALTRRGRLVIVGGETDGRWLGGSDRQLRALALSPFISQTLRTFVASENADDLTVLRDQIEAGKLAPAVTGPIRSARCQPRSATCWTAMRRARS